MYVYTDKERYVGRFKEKLIDEENTKHVFLLYFCRGQSQRHVCSQNNKVLQI